MERHLSKNISFKGWYSYLISKLLVNATTLLYGMLDINDTLQRQDKQNNWHTPTYASMKGVPSARKQYVTICITPTILNG